MVLINAVGIAPTAIEATAIGERVVDSEHDLYMMVGEIRSDVKKLLAASGDTDRRITSLERSRWWATGFAACLGVLVAKVALLTKMFS